MYKGEVIKRFWSLSDARNFLDYAENHERIKTAMVAKVQGSYVRRQANQTQPHSLTTKTKFEERP
jgi:hypothetical protein